MPEVGSQMENVVTQVLSLIFQYVHTEELLIYVSHCCKKFYSVSKLRSSWRFSCLGRARRITGLPENDRRFTGVLGASILAANLRSVSQLLSLNLDANIIR